MNLSLEQIRFCTEECERQNVTPICVANMCYAYADVQVIKDVHGTQLNMDHVLHLGKMIEPEQNRKGFRRVPVFFDGIGIDQAIAPEHIERQLDLLLDIARHNTAVSSDELYQQFEEIHPFIDGNGRVGALLYNYWRNSLDHPQTPPEFKK